MNKKGQELMRMLGKLVAVGILLIVMFSIMLGQLGLLKGEVPSGTEKGFREVVQVARATIEGSKACKKFSLGIEEGWVIMGFDSPVIKDTCPTPDVFVQRPQPCGEQPCFCLCKEDERCKGFAKCQTFSGLNHIAAVKDTSGNYIEGDTHPYKGEYVAMYGDCGPEWETREMSFCYDDQAKALEISVLS